jgi:hypothetical protein
MSSIFPQYPNALLGGNFLPPPESLLSAYARVIAEANRKPRNQSEWEARFAYWQKPASETEEAEIEAIARRVRQALKRSTFLPQRDWSIVKQGSYHNNTNTRAGSDVDLCVCLNDAFFVDGPASDFPSKAELGRQSTPFTFEEYRQHIALCLAEEFGVSAVTFGQKAIHLHKEDQERINADVVPAFTFQRFGPRISPTWQRRSPDVGVALLTTTGQRITNFPAQHYVNGCAKNDRTGRRYKRVVRILKRLRDHMIANPDLPQAACDRAKSAASFLIESLVYNCDIDCFQNASIYGDVVAVLDHLDKVLADRRSTTTVLGSPTWYLWTEVNGLKSLFDGAAAVADAADFVGLARSYMGV